MKNKVDLSKKSNKPKIKTNIVGDRIVCIITSIICTVVAITSALILDYKVDNYDYSTIKEVNGTVLDIKSHSDEDGTTYTLSIGLGSKSVNIDIGSSLGEHYIGERIPVYTDDNEQAYGLSERDIAVINSHGTLLNMITILAVMIQLAVWVCFYRFGGFFIGMIVALIVFLISI